MRLENLALYGNANTEYPALLNIPVDWPSPTAFPPTNFDHLQYVQIKSYHVILITSLLCIAKLWE